MVSQSCPSVTRSYVAASVNRYPNVMDWGFTLIAYGSCNSIALFNVHTKRIDHMLMKHKGYVRCVRWIIPDKILISCSASSETLIWKSVQNGQFEVTLELNVKSDDTFTNIVADSIIQDDTLTSVTSGSDFNLRFWKNDTQFGQVDVKNFAFDVRIIKSEQNLFDTSVTTYAYATADCLVIVSQMSPSGQNVQLLKLTGHTDWIRCIDFKFENSDNLILSSASQDSFIRVWRIKKRSKVASKYQNQDSEFCSELETVLAGHEAQVNCVKFVPSFGKSSCRSDKLSSENDKSRDKLSLMSSSRDKSIIIWKEEEDCETWNEILRVGEIGGNNLGFFGVSFPKDVQDVQKNTLTSFSAFSFNGSLHIWTFNQELEIWQPDVGFGGHSNVVTDISWDIDGHYLLSTSKDETTRLHSQWVREGSNSNLDHSWHEVARPQIHGYLINCISTIDGVTFVSGADEKVLRIFRATNSFLEHFKNISNLNIKNNHQQLPQSATVQPLGLSNLAVYQDQSSGDQGLVKFEDEAKHSPQSIKSPPTEEVLMQTTLWPEIHKLYGHGHELYSVAASHDGTLIASGCKASKSSDARVLIWNVSNGFKELPQALDGHNLTVTSIKFSPDDQFLVTVSRDRTWFLYKRSGDTLAKVSNSNKTNCIHSRIIWDVSWTFESKYFVTVSRDKKVVIWSLDNMTGQVTPLKDDILTLDESVTSLDIHKCPGISSGGHLIAFGLENGRIDIYRWSESVGWSKVDFESGSRTFRHHASVTKVRFSPKVDMTDKSGKALVTLASAGEDFATQIFTIYL